MGLRVAADLSFEMQVEGGDAVHGRLCGTDSQLLLEVDEPGAFAGRGDAPAVAALAGVLAGHDITVKVAHDGWHLVSLGAVSAPWWQRRFTGSRRIRLGSLRGAWSAGRARAGAGVAVLPDPGLVPPPTLFPMAPTFGRRPRRRPTTTHDPARGGGARLVLSKQDMWAGERQPVFWLGENTTIGSDPGRDVVLKDLEAVHARIVHDDQDEYVVSSVAGITRVHGGSVRDKILRTGARLDLGVHHLAFFREEFADHGRLRWTPRRRGRPPALPGAPRERRLTQPPLVQARGGTGPRARWALLLLTARRQ